MFFCESLTSLAGLQSEPFGSYTGFADLFIILIYVHFCAPA